MIAQGWTRGMENKIAVAVREITSRPLANARVFWAGWVENRLGWVEFCIEHKGHLFSGEWSRNLVSHTVLFSRRYSQMYLVKTQFNGDDVNEIRHHLPGRWDDYSGSPFRFNLWNPVYWIMECWQLKIQTIMYCLCDNTKQRWLDMSMSEKRVTKWLTFCRQYF